MLKPAPFPRALIRRRHLDGFNLIEVLVAVAVLAIGLLGVAALQVQGVRYNYGAYARSQAVMLAHDYAERIYANPPGRIGVAADLYAGLDSNSMDCDAEPAALCGTQSDADTPVQCAAAEMATYDRYVSSCGYPTSSGRSGGIRDLLTEGRLRVTCVDTSDTAVACATGSLHRILVTWQERGSSNSGTTVQDAEFRMVVRP